MKTESKLSAGGIVAVFFGGLSGLYFLVFGFIVLDGFVFNDWLFDRSPEWFRESIRVVYWPLVWILKSFF